MKLLKRTLTGIFILALSFFFISKGGYYLLFMGLFLSSIAVYELENTVNRSSLKGINVANLSTNLIFDVIFNVAMFNKKYQIALALIALACLFQLANYAILDKDIKLMYRNIFIYLYITVSFSLMYLISKSEYIWLLYICSWGTDTSAYCVGMLFGKHKLTKISPKKTVEGAIGGVIGSILIALIFSLISGKFGVIEVIAIVFFGSIISQIGDISASKIKRNANIKDFGNIFIGHGGVMDRFDSFVFVLPYIVILFSILN